jgi:hypothetical protein
MSTTIMTLFEAARNRGILAPQGTSEMAISGRVWGGLRDLNPHKVPLDGILARALNTTTRTGRTGRTKKKA